ncbi:hypothetical protein DL762_010146 [Monosporascus cannonballus]|uniref:Ubiquitin-like domain-containing protein n=1 Tax=Monosporascus cannonballus TaxID=155416 RepID=A0ABY0GW75_9PEZI|nr:hypothetical protein DL762_010146 [Monosporascus cannonballus]
MEDPQPPSTQPKRKLLFKRTIPRKPVEKPKDDSDDGLALFSRSKEFFPDVIKDQQREAAEKAAKAEKERRERLERARKEREEALKLQDQFHRDEDEEDDGATSAKKRHRMSLSSDESDNVFTTRPQKSQKSSSATPKPPSARRDSLSRYHTRTPRSTRSSRASRPTDTNAAVISLDSSDEETKHATSLNKRSPSVRKPSPTKLQDTLEESDLELEGGPHAGGDGDADFDCYIQGALERAEKRKRERLEREAAEGAGGKDAGGPEPVVQILISSALDGIQPIAFKRKLFQPLAVVHRTWVQIQLNKQAPVPLAVLQDMFFTWRGDKVYGSATLAALGIQPSVGDGSLYPAWERDPPAGYFGRDKVHFEAWTPELYEEFLRDRELERMRARGEWLPEDHPDGETGGDGKGTEEPDQEETKIKLSLKARDMDPENVRVRPSTTISMLSIVFRRLKRLPADKEIELRWDGEVLDPNTTVEDADIEDMDSIEVYVK